MIIKKHKVWFRIYYIQLGSDHEFNILNKLIIPYRKALSIKSIPAPTRNESNSSLLF
jgi:hypothetical protein